MSGQEDLSAEAAIPLPGSPNDEPHVTFFHERGSGYRATGPHGHDSDDHGPQTPELAAAPQSTFQQKLQIDVKEPVGNMSISPAGRDVVLAARKGLFIIDLEHPYEPPRFLPQGGTWEVADIQWNPHPARAELIVSTSSQKLLIWNLYLSGKSSIEQILHAHYRAITDINWHAYQPDVVASCGIDSWIWSWDLRQGSKPAMGFCAWNASATQVKWNRQDEHILASSHDNNVLIWDRRVMPFSSMLSFSWLPITEMQKGSVPLLTMQAHDTKIYGIDWSRRRRNELVTCSLDKTIKFWRFDNLSPVPHSPLDRVSAEAAAGLQTFQPTNIIRTTYPVWRARHLPFGHGVLSLPQRGENTLELWGYNSPEAPVERFEGHENVVKEFVWRTKGGQDLSYEDRQFQLITWSKDHTLRGWPIEPETAEKVGYKRGAPIKVLISRRNAENISFRIPPEAPPVRKATFSAPIGTRTVLAGVRATPQPLGRFTGSAGKERELRTRPGARPKRGGVPEGGFMTRGHAGRRTGVDQMSWITSVKLQRRGEGMGTDSPADGATSYAASRASSADGRGGDRRARSSSRSRDGRDTEKPSDIAQEMASVAQTYCPKVKFEKIDVTARTCTISLHGPWLESDTVFLRMTFTFPVSYPRSDSPSSTPHLELEKSSSLPIKTRAFLLKHLREMRQHRRPCLEPCIRFLLGLPDREGLFGRPSPFEDDSSSDDEGRTGRQPTREGLTRRFNMNVPLARRGGATWGPNGQLVYFFPPPAFRLMQSHLKPSRSPSIMSRTTNISDRSVLHEHDSHALVKAMVGLMRMSADHTTAASDVHPHNGNHTSLDLNGGAQETSSLRARTRDSHGSGETSDRVSLRPTLGPIPSIHIGDFSYLLPSDRELGRAYAVKKTSLRELCDTNAVHARTRERPDLERMWNALAAVVTNEPFTAETLPERYSDDKDASDIQKSLATVAWDRNPMARHVIMELFSEAIALRDIQMLGMMSCVLLQAREGKKLKRRRTRALSFALKPEVDAFTLKSPVEIRIHIPPLAAPMKRPSPNLSSPSPPSQPSSSSRHSWSSFLGSVPSLLLRGASDTTPPASTTPHHRTLSQEALKSPPASSDVAPGAIPIPRSLKSPWKSQTRVASKLSESTTSPTALKSLSDPVKSFAGKMLVTFLSEGHRRESEHFPKTSVLKPTREHSGVTVHWKGSPSRTTGTSSSFFTARVEGQLRTYVLAYAELLSRWQLFHYRAELWDACFPKQSVSDLINQSNEQQDKRTNLMYRFRCQRCHLLFVDPLTFVCAGCRAPAQRPKCTICRLPVARLDHVCILCGHCIHQQCLGTFRHSTRASSLTCPGGCGCKCDVSGAFPVAKSDLLDSDLADPAAGGTSSKAHTPRGRSLERS